MSVRLVELDVGVSHLLSQRTVSLSQVNDWASIQLLGILGRLSLHSYVVRNRNLKMSHSLVFEAVGWRLSRRLLKWLGFAKLV